MPFLLKNNFLHWSITGNWVTASLLRSLGLFSVFRLFSIAEAWMVSTRPPTSKSSSPFNNPLVSVLKAPRLVQLSPSCSTFFFQFPCKVEVLILLFTFFFLFYSVVSWDSKVHNLQILFFLFFLLIVINSGILAKIRWSSSISKSHRSLCGM